MVATLKTDVIEKSDGSPVDLTGQSAAKVWANFNGTGTVILEGSFNISGLADNGTGNYTLSFTSVMSSANYSSSGLSLNTLAEDTALATSFGVLNLATSTGAVVDGVSISTQVLGDLA